MMKLSLLSATAAAGAGARLAQVDAVSHDTILAAEMVSLLPAQCVSVQSDSFSSALNAAIGSEIGGFRALVASSMLRSPDEISSVSLMRMPLVIANVSRPVGPSVMSARDQGSLIFMPQDNLDVVESVMQAYRVSEDPKVMLPSIVNIEIPYFSESVELPNEAFARRFIPKKARFDVKKPIHFSLPADRYDELRREQRTAMKSALDLLEKSSQAWKKKFKRTLPLVESYRAEDADLIMVVAGFHSTTAKAAVDVLRKNGRKAGLVRLRVARPWPFDAMRVALANAKKVAVYDHASALGTTGLLYGDVRGAAQFCSDYVAQGTHPSEKDFIALFDRLEKSEKEEVAWI